MPHTSRNKSPVGRSKSRGSGASTPPPDLTDCFFDHLEGEKVEKTAFVKSMKKQQKQRAPDLRRPSAILPLDANIGDLLSDDPAVVPPNLTDCFFDHLEGEKVEKLAFISSMRRQAASSRSSEGLRRPSAALIDNMASLDLELLEGIDELACPAAPALRSVTSSGSKSPTNMTDKFFDHLEGKSQVVHAPPKSPKSPKTRKKKKSGRPPVAEQKGNVPPQRNKLTRRKDPRTVESCYGNQHPTVQQLRIPMSDDESLRVIDVDF